MCPCFVFEWRCGGMKSAERKRGCLKITICRDWRIAGKCFILQSNCGTKFMKEMGKESKGWENVLSSYGLMAALLGVYAAGLAVATWIEKVYGTALAKVVIYYSPVFFLVQLLMVMNFVAIVLRRRFWESKRWGLLVVHVALVVILGGALVSHFTGVEGVVHLREGQRMDQMEVVTNRGHGVHRLPFGLELEKFRLVRYPGSESPSSYESDVIVHGKNGAERRRISMNKVLDEGGYRLFQASFDTDERGSVLSVNKDVAGRRVTYGGYVMLLAGFILSLFDRNGRVRVLYRLINAHKSAARAGMVALLCCLSSAVVAEGDGEGMLKALEGLKIPPAHVERFGALALQSADGRVVPVNTFSSEVLRKIHRDTHIGGLDSDGFLLSLFAMPEMWQRAPLIAVRNGEIAALYGLQEDGCAFADFFDDEGAYRLQERLDGVYRKLPGERDRFDKDLIRLDEQVYTFYQLINYQLFNIFPSSDGGDEKWYAPGDDLSGFSERDSFFVSHVFEGYLADVREALRSGDWDSADEMLGMIGRYQQSRNRNAEADGRRMGVELRYNRLDPFGKCKVGYLSAGGILLVLSFLSFFRGERWLKWAIRVVGILVLIVFHFHMLGMGMRWRIGGYAPWSNSYETMVYVSWATVLAGILFVRRSPLTTALATLFAGIILVVSGLSWMDPQIHPLVPVLKSPWLMFHVAVLMAAYGFFGIGFLLGFVNMILVSIVRKDSISARMATIRELTLINELSLIVGLMLMTTGTFIGAVWANETWGRYWGWDPKETWALITIVVYVLVTHLHLVRKWYNLWSFNLGSVLAFASVLMTYFGVNYFLSGMHSYGQNEQIGGIFVYLAAAGCLVLLLAIVSRKGLKFKI